MKAPDMRIANITRLATHIGVWVGLCATTSLGDEASDALEILNRHCSDCHANGNKDGAFGFVDDLVQLVKKGKVLPKNAVESSLYVRMISDEMPPEGEEPTGERPTNLEKQKIADWIRSGAQPVGTKNAEPTERRFLAVGDELQRMNDYLASLPRSQRKHQRFFSLRNVSNNQKRNAAEIDVYRAALGKTLNSLSWKSEMVVPIALHDDAVTFAVNLRDLGWDASTWDNILSHYPYGIRHTSMPRDRDLNEMAEHIYRETETEVPAMRVDWFVVTATRPPLYHDLLGIPKRLQRLEHRLGVDAIRNIKERQVARAGVVNSGISDQHRLIERHNGTFGYYWKSYDFSRGSARSDLTRFPLGPNYRGNPFSELAFDHDGGEFIFRLPNRLQGYMLSDAQGNRLDGPAPVDIVSDKMKISGSVQIFNGISCIGCHGQGMIRTDDIVRSSSLLNGRASEFMEDLYLTPEAMNRLYEMDEKSFRRAALDSMRGIVKNQDWLEKSDGSIVEPVLSVVRFYTHHPLYVDDLAAELGLEQVVELKAAVKYQERLTNLGLGPMQVPGGAIKRQTWEQISASGRSMYQRAANLLKLGEPIVTYSQQH